MFRSTTAHVANAKVWLNTNKKTTGFSLYSTTQIARPLHNPTGPRRNAYGKRPRQQLHHTIQIPLSSLASVQYHFSCLEFLSFFLSFFFLFNSAWKCWPSFGGVALCAKRMYIWKVTASRSAEVTADYAQPRLCFFLFSFFNSRHPPPHPTLPPPPHPLLKYFISYLRSSFPI